jgi:hypothetical protein
VNWETDVFVVRVGVEGKSVHWLGFDYKSPDPAAEKSLRLLMKERHKKGDCAFFFDARSAMEAGCDPAFAKTIFS